MTELIKAGDTISVHYTGKFESGEVFDTSEGRDALKFTVGSGQLIKGFDTAVTGMNVGEKKTVTISPDQAYGEKNNDYIIDMPKSAIPPDAELEVGMRLQLVDQNGHPVPAVVDEIQDEIVKMDINHPLAGKTLVFDIEVVETGLTPDPHHCGCGDDGCGDTKENDECCGGHNH